MSDLYVHHPFEATPAQADNLVTLARYLVQHGSHVDARGLRFGKVSMQQFRPLPGAALAETGIPLPPLAYGPSAGIAALPGEDWRSYLKRAFGVVYDQPFIRWLQGAGWRTTEPSAVGAALRIAYVLDYGIPHDHAEIEAGLAGTDYDMNGFLWDRLNLLPPGYTGGPLTPLRIWPERKGQR